MVANGRFAMRPRLALCGDYDAARLRGGGSEDEERCPGAYRLFASYTDLVDHCCEPGTSSSNGPGRSCPSDSATGPMGSDQRDLVLKRSPVASNMPLSAH